MQLKNLTNPLDIIICKNQFKPDSYSLLKIKNVFTLFSTDLSLDANTILWFYKTRFQIEFLFRDAKQFLGLNHYCQAH